MNQYGYQNWQKDIPKDILGKSSDGQTPPDNKQGDLTYGIFKVEGDRLYLGDEKSGDGETEQNRPTRLDIERPLTKQ